MGIKHSVTKTSGEEGYASEWNEEHIIDSDINFNGFSGTNIREPVNNSDIATKYYTDGVEASILTYVDNKEISILNYVDSTIAGISFEGDNLGDHTAIQDLNMSGFYVYNVAEPTSPSDVATKNYVDGKIPPSGPKIKYYKTHFASMSAYGSGSINIYHGEPTAPNFVFTSILGYGTNLDQFQSHIMNITSSAVAIAVNNNSDKSLGCDLFVQMIW